MKKKMLFMAAIAGLVTLGSCVKDDVSGSVEAVRQAKANQLNAQAAYDNARAAHQNAISAASVALEQANAAAQAATAKATELANQVTAAALDAEIAKTIAGYEKDLAKAKADLQDELNNLATNERAAAINLQGDINTAVTAYNTALGFYTAAQKKVITAELRLAAAKNDAEHADLIQANAIKGYEKTIAEKTALIEALKEIQAEGTSIGDVKAEIAKLDAEIHNAMTKYGNTDEVKALVEAGQALAEAKTAFDLVEGASFGAVNAMAADAFGQDYPAGSIKLDDGNGNWVATTKKVRIPVGGVYHTLADVAVTQGASWDPTLKNVDYYVASGSKTIKSKAAVTGYPFFDYTSYRYEYTADNYDANGVYYLDPAYTVPDGVMDDVPGWTADGDYYLDGSNFTVKTYRVNELVKNAADEYFMNYPSNAKTALDNAKNELKDLEAQLGTSSDAKDKKYTKVDGTDGGLTDYAKLNAAKDALSKAQSANTTAQNNYSGKPAAVQTALNALIAENEKKAVDDTKWIAAVVNLADAVVAAYGAPNYDPNLKKYSTPGNDQDAIDYLIGVNAANTLGYTKAWMQDPDNVKLLFKNGDAKCIVTAWATGTYTKDATNAAKVEKVANRKYADGRDNVVQIAKVKAAELGDKNDAAGTPQVAPGDPLKETAYAAVKSAEEVIFGQFNLDHQLIAKGTNQDIADKKEEIIQKEADYSKADKVKAGYEAAIAAADITAYEAAAADLQTAADDFNAAAADVAAWEEENIVSKQDEKTALQNAIKSQDVEAQILEAEKAIADAKQSIANWENEVTVPATPTTPAEYGNNSEWVIAQAEADLIDAKADLASCTADLKAAEAALVALVGELDIDYDLDEDEPEPTPEPEPEPTPEPEPETPAENTEG
jgi:hypothetical protein